MCAAIGTALPLASFAQGSDADVLAAKDAAQRGQWKAVEAYRARLAGHLLEAYPSYWLLAGSVDRADPRDVRAFLDRYPSSPLSESLRREWLRARPRRGRGARPCRISEGRWRRRGDRLLPFQERLARPTRR